MDELIWKVDRATDGDRAGWEMVAACKNPEEAAMLVASLSGGRVRVGRTVVLEDFDGSISLKSYDEAANRMMTAYAIALKDGRVKSPRSLLKAGG